ncbi:MAG: GNAT family N-acetyltransferase [Balneolales bacterium]
MKITIVESKKADFQEWNDVWKNCEYATYFHSPDWLRIWEIYSNGNISTVSQKISFSDGKSAILVISTKYRLGKIISIHESSPGHNYGGWISRDTLNPEHKELLTYYLIKHYPNLIWRVNPFEQQFSIVDKRLQNDQTYAVPLEQPWGELYNLLNRSKLPKKVRKAERNKLELQKISPDSLDDYMEIYHDAKVRWKKKHDIGSIYTKELFNLLVHSEHCDFWGVYHRNNLICAGPFLKSSTHVVVWGVFALSASLHMRPFEFIYYNLICYYRDKGYKWFDFNPSGKRKGVEEFKQQFATKELICPVLDTRSAPLKLVQKAKSLFS